MKSIYMCATPYHLLLACGIASQNHANEKHLIIIPHFQNYSKFIDAIREWNANPFSEIQICHERKDKDFLDKQGTIQTNLAMSHDFIRHRKYSHAYIFNIEQPEGQYLAFLSGCQNIYVEDGIGAYLKKKTGDSFPIRFIKKILYGYWFERCDNQMDCKLIHAVMAFKPEYIDTKYHKITIEPNIFNQLKDLIPILSKKYEIPQFETEIILLLPYSEQAKAMGFKNTWEAYGKFIDSTGHATMIMKYHPREGKINSYLKTNNHISNISNSIPAELLFFNWKAKNKILVSDTSTGLCSAKIINPDIKAFSLMDLIGFQEDEGIREALFAFGVKIPKSNEEILCELH